MMKSKAYLVTATRIFLDDSLPLNYAKVKGYSPWFRRDRSTRKFRGVAVFHCTSLGLTSQQLTPEIPEHFELMFFSIYASATA